MEREASAAWAALPRSARRIFEIISGEIADAGGTSVPLRYLDFESRGVAMNALPVALRTLAYLGLIDRHAGVHLVGIYALSDRFKVLDEDEVQRLLAAAREVKPRQVRNALSDRRGSAAAD